MLTGTIINAVTVIAGGAAGLIFKKKLSAKYEIIYFQTVGLFTLLLGVKMAINMSEPLPVILSLVAGGFIGIKLRLEERTERMGDCLKTLVRLKDERFTEGLIAGFLLFCTGSMTVLGAVEEGFGKTSDLLLTKSVMDFFSAIMLASALGAGVLFSAIPLLMFQGGITLAVYFTGKDIPPAVIDGITTVGGVMLMGLSINLLQLKKISVINLLPSLLFITAFILLKMLAT
ncbi:MAG: DUF554 domain-containing protein [Prevotellaceae bacterium]|jgi:uncharacterized membrane protein YqgA involved in biofilm formation|nr:DUF554 domain-containing protein [Prevotellaceae bacterium]